MHLVHPNYCHVTTMCVREREREREEGRRERERERERLRENVYARYIVYTFQVLVMTLYMYIQNTWYMYNNIIST